MCFSYNLEGASIPRVSVVSGLGVRIDSALVLHEHVSLTVNAALRGLGVISPSCRQFSSRLEFSSVIWNSLSIPQGTAI